MAADELCPVFLAAYTIDEFHTHYFIYVQTEVNRGIYFSPDEVEEKMELIEGWHIQHQTEFYGRMEPIGRLCRKKGIRFEAICRTIKPLADSSGVGFCCHLTQLAIDELKQQGILQALGPRDDKDVIFRRPNMIFRCGERQA